MTSNEIAVELEALRAEANTVAREYLGQVPLWEIAYQLAKQVEEQQSANQLTRSWMKLQIAKSHELADPQPGKRYADDTPADIPSDPQSEHSAAEWEQLWEGSIYETFKWREWYSERLEKFGRHLDNCATISGGPCTCGFENALHPPAESLPPSTCGTFHAQRQRPQPSEPEPDIRDQTPPINPSEARHPFQRIESSPYPYCFRCGGGRLHVIHTVKDSYSLAGSGDTKGDASGNRCKS